MSGTQGDHYTQCSPCSPIGALAATLAMAPDALVATLPPRFCLIDVKPERVLRGFPRPSPGWLTDMLGLTRLRLQHQHDSPGRDT